MALKTTSHKQCLSVESMVVLLDDPNRSTSFFQTLDRQLASENGSFYKSYQKFEVEKGNMSVMEKKERIEWFYNEYIVEGSPNELNIPKHILADFEKEYALGEYDISILYGVRKEVLKMMYQNTYRLGDFEHEDEGSTQGKKVHSVKLKKSLMQRFLGKMMMKKRKNTI